MNENPLSVSEYETRFVKLNRATPDAVMPYVKAALSALGHGNALAIDAGPGIRGIQITVPVNALHNLEAVIESYDQDALKDPPQILDAIKTRSDAARLCQLLRDLDLCPDDLRLTTVKEGSLLLIVSGPASRKAFVENVLKPRILDLEQKIMG